MHVAIRQLRWTITVQVDVMPWRRSRTFFVQLEIRSVGLWIFRVFVRIFRRITMYVRQYASIMLRSWQQWSDSDSYTDKPGRLRNTNTPISGGSVGGVDLPECIYTGTNLAFVYWATLVIIIARLLCFVVNVEHCYRCPEFCSIRCFHSCNKAAFCCSTRGRPYYSTCSAWNFTIPH